MLWKTRVFIQLEIIRRELNPDKGTPKRRGHVQLAYWKAVSFREIKSSRRNRKSQHFQWLPFKKTVIYPVWCNTSKKNISKLQKVQNFACRIITGKRKFDHITPVLRELRWLSVTSFLKYTLGVLAFKCVKALARPSYLCHRFKTRACVHDRNTRYKNNLLNIPAYKSASGQRTFLYRAMSFWNSLPREIRECDNLPIFKRHLKEFLSSF